MAELQIDSQVVGGVPTIYLQGELDSYSAPRVRNILETLTESRQPAILVDMTGLEYIDSAGLGVLVAALKDINDHDGALALIGLTPAVARVFRVTGLDNLFTVCGDAVEAHTKLGLTTAAE
jgi:anti-sigma B factor antagonist